ncbi:hypothetical protein CCR75_006516 [Bremia lactucae]|uniref:Uncharacterized protein n=1 Tax=Bremia lactucae TaxID=4779 RepID=A0A976FFM7_BRELC|nr:hypothetical protein CCR75_006516 [Bremia lactucae]
MLQAFRKVKDGVDVTHVSHLDNQLYKAIHQVSKIPTLRLSKIPKSVTKSDLKGLRICGYKFVLSSVVHL